MAIEQTTVHWKKQDTVRSIFTFVGHFFLLVLVAAVLLLSDKVSNLKQDWAKNSSYYVYAIFCIALIVSILYCYFYFENKNVLVSGKNITLVFTLLDLYLIIAYLFGKYLSIYARPVAFVALMAFVLIGRKEAIFLNIISALLLFVIDTFAVDTTTAIEGYSSLIISFSAGMLAIFFCEKAKTRVLIVIIGMIIVIPIDFVILLLGSASVIGQGGEFTFEGEAWQVIFTDMGYGFLGGVMSTVFFLTVLPIFEGIFNCLTVFRLRELTSPDAKILKKLREAAPGTYIHSMMVAQLAEASAAAIGEDVDYARAAAMYHDVGKMHHPDYFTENQGDYNLHDDLLPELSADMIRSHAKDGAMVIRSHHLPDFLADVALQHHGTLPIRYFYAKALKLTDGELNIEDFSYLGPKPQSRIAAIIMIADAAEAVVRANNSKSPELAEKAIRTIIEERMDLEQFSECNITMVDLTKIRMALVDALTGVHHHRIKYPNIKYRHSEDGTTKGENV